MSPEEVGKLTKTKYPQYAGMSDVEVGAKVIQKYPQYGSKDGGKGISIGKFGDALLKPLTDVARPVVGAVQMFAPTVDAFASGGSKQSIDKWNQSYNNSVFTPEDKAMLSDTGSSVKGGLVRGAAVTPYLLPAGSGIGARAALGAAGGGISSATSGGDLKDIATSSLIGAGANVLLGAGTDALTKVFKKVPGPVLSPEAKSVATTLDDFDKMIRGGNNAAVEEKQIFIDNILADDSSPLYKELKNVVKGNLRSGNSVINPGMVAGATEKELPAISGAINKVGQNIETKGESLITKGWGRPQMFANFDEKFGKGAAEDIIKRMNITRDEAGLTKLNDFIENELQAKYDSIVGTTNKKIGIDKIYSQIESRINELRASHIGAYDQKAKALENELMGLLDTYGNKEVNVADLTLRRKEYDKLVSTYKFDDATKSVYQELRDELQKLIYKETENLGPAKALGKELNKFYEFRDKIAIPASKLGTTTKMLSGIRDVLPGTITAAVTHNPVVGAGTFIAEKLASSPAGVATTSKLVSGAGKALSKFAGVTGAIENNPFVKGVTKGTLYKGISELTKKKKNFTEVK